MHPNQRDIIEETASAIERALDQSFNVIQRVDVELELARFASRWQNVARELRRNYE